MRSLLISSRNLVRTQIQSKFQSFTTQSTKPLLTDFQGNPGVEHFNKYVKLGDSLALSILLLRTTLIQQKVRHNKSLLVHDIGGADGYMMFTLLRILNLSAMVSVNEPNPDRRNKYKEKQTLYTNFFTSIEVSNKKIEDKSFIIPNNRELILASHVLYYNQDSWLTCPSLKEHLFTKLFRSLHPGGVLCVVLQHTPMMKPSSHELWEDFIYPLLQSVKHEKNKYYASAELFDTALSLYRKQFIFEMGCAIDWTIQEKIAETRVPLGRINITPDAQGHYPQTDEVLEILNFYLKGSSFTELTADLQKKIIELIITYFRKMDQYEIVHYNKTYCIEVGETLFARLQSLDLASHANDFLSLK